MVTRAVSCPLVPPGVRLTSGRCSESNSGRIRSRNYTGIALCLKQIFQRAHPPAILLHKEFPIGQLNTNRRPQLFRGHAKLKTRSTWAAAVAPAVRRRWWGSCCGCAGAGGLRPCWGGGLVVAFFTCSPTAAFHASPQLAAFRFQMDCRSPGCSCRLEVVGFFHREALMGWEGLCGKK